jgi:class 3 adenylate cyclase/CHAT domain-containing protein
MQEKEDIGKLLRERDRIDGKLHEHRKKIAIMFMDIKGSTDYFDRWGDIEGRLMVQRCEDIILPIINKHKGVEKHLGDGVMAYFESTESAVNTAMEIQRALKIYNEGKQDQQQAHVRIGVNSGMVFLMEKGDISGDEVNVASRVESLAPVDGIYATRSVYEDVRNSEEIICRYIGEKTVKGKAEPLSIYQVIWAEEEMTVGMLRGPEVAELPSPIDEKLLHLDFLREGEKIRVRSYEGKSGEQKTLKHYEDLKISIGKTGEYSKKVKDLLNRANRSGKISKDILNSLKQEGQLLYDDLFPARAKEMLNSTKLNTLVLGIDDGLVHIPWELVFDGKEFLCQRFNMGRVVSTRQEFVAAHRDVDIPLKMLVLSDPQGNLPASYQEGVAIRDRLDAKAYIFNVNLKSSDIGTDYVRAKLRYFDIVHYAGHSDYDVNDPSNSGFLLSDGKLSAKDISNMTGRMPLPAFVFSNACHSGQTDEWKVEEGYENVFGLANAFLLSGVRHYLGTFWQIQDEPSLYFALAFYEELTKGAMIGEAVNRARMGLLNKYGEDTIIWASYMLYGDPTFRYVDLSKQVEEQRPIAAEETVASPSRSSEEVVVFPRRKSNWYIMVAALLAIAIVFGAYIMSGEKSSESKPSVQAQAPVSPAEEQRKAEEIDRLVSELTEKYKAGNIPVVSRADDWTSIPLSLVFLDVKANGINETEKEYILAKATENLQESGRMSMVDRQILDKLLQELKLSSSELADTTTALKIGRILSARLITTGSMIKDKDDWIVSLRIIETETTAVKSAVTLSMSKKDRDAVSGEISGKMLQRIKKEYPLQGIISSVKEKSVSLNIGSGLGLTKGARMEVFTDEMDSIGELEITSVRSGKARADIISMDEDIREGLRAREIL